MSENNALDRKSMDVLKEPDGVLEHLSLPPKMITFIRKNQRRIWICIACLTVVVVTVSLYGSYRTRLLEQAASALDQALHSTGDKEVLLQKVIDKYGSTPSALWAQVELATFYETGNEPAKAVDTLRELAAILPGDSLLVPLVSYRTAVLYERQGALDDALGQYTLLSQKKGYESLAYKSMGRVYEQQKKTEQAVRSYRQYLETVQQAGQGSQADQEKEIIEARLRMLENK
ncbi:MAG: hypothetical protein CSA32_03790 [Desulfobulbus propionicus]|nr:MAG: hypothetical protein CSA32_03790 [Desulfobulbus propionicus]